MRNPIFQSKKLILLIALLFVFNSPSSQLIAANIASACEDPNTLTVTKTDSVDPILVNGETTYTIIVSNSGSSDQDVKVVDFLPAQLDYVSGSANINPSQVSSSKKTVTWNIVSVKKHGSATITYNAKGVLTGTGTNTVKIYVGCTEKGSASENTTVNAPVVCGDGTVNQASEQCDAGLANGVVCTAAYGQTCSYCSNTCQTVTVTGPKCGDGVKNGSEACDGYDGIGAHQVCSLDCTIVNQPYCGDGQVNQTSEQCEGQAVENCTIGGFNGSHVCNAQTCQWNDCILQTYCGNGQIDPGEQCDGNLGVGAHQTCNQCTLVNLPYCGDGIKNGDEQCDGQDGVGAHQTCSATCTLVDVPYCGDSQVNQASEQCDAGQSNGQVCVPQYGGNCSYCSTECTNVTVTGPKCGDGVLNGNEQCDDGNIVNGDGCSSVCQIETTPPSGTTSLTICKYEDGDANIETTGDRTAVAGWQFSIARISTSTEPIVGFSTATTTENGCVTLADIATGNYAITETLQNGWHYLSPANGSATTTVVSGNSSTINFYNYRNGSISGFKYQDADGNVNTAGDRTPLAGWFISLYTGTSTLVATTTTDNSGNYQFNNLLPGTYSLTEAMVSGWQQIAAPAASIVLTSGLTSANNNFINYLPGTIQVCTNNCGGGGGGGGGGIILIFPKPEVLGIKIGSLTVKKTAEKSVVVPGEKMIQYSFTITNTTGALTDDVKAVDTLPDGFVFPDTGQKTRTWDVGTMQAGESRTYQYHVNALDGINSGIYTNKVEVTSQSGDPVISTVDVTVKSAGKVLGIKLQNTGFDLGEFGDLASIVILLIGSAIYLKRKTSLVNV